MLDAASALNKSIQNSHFSRGAESTERRAVSVRGALLAKGQTPHWAKCTGDRTPRSSTWKRKKKWKMGETIKRAKRGPICSV